MQLSGALRFYIYTFGLAALSSCGELPEFRVGQKSDHAIQSIDSANFSALDLLFVVDNSNSMAEEQENLANSFGSFIAQFSERGLDFHIGVVSTDATASSMKGWWTGKAKINSTCVPAYRGIVNGGPGTLLSRDKSFKFLTPQVPDYIEKFKSNVRLGVCGSAAETGVLSAFQFFAPSNLAEGGYNEGFLRPEGYLAVVFLSDEDESISPSEPRYLKKNPQKLSKRIDEFAKRFSALKPERPEMLRIDAIVAPSEVECQTVYNNDGVSGVGDAYIRLAGLFNGKVSNICQNFSSQLVNIGSQILTFLTRFPLLQPPENADVEVRVNGQLVPKAEDHGWVLVEVKDKHFVEFRGTKIPANGDKIKITYVPAKPAI